MPTLGSQFVMADSMQTGSVALVVVSIAVVAAHGLVQVTESQTGLG